MTIYEGKLSSYPPINSDGSKGVLSKSTFAETLVAQRRAVLQWG